MVLVGLGAVVVRDAPPELWAVPLQPGPLADGWSILDLRRTPDQVLVTVALGETRAGLRVRQRDRLWSDTPARFAGRYRVELTAGEVPPPVLDAVADRLAAWEAQRPRPPAFVSHPGERAAWWQPWERRALDLALIAWLVALVLGARREDAPPASAWATAAVSGALMAVLGVAGPWHANQHAYERIADLQLGAAPWAASLGLLHGFGFYTLMHPLVGGGPDGGRDVFVCAAGVTLAALLVWSGALRRLLGPRQGELALTALGGSSLLLRVGATEAMYVPALLYLGGVALAVERVVERPERSVWPILPPLLLAMQTRADLLLLAPAAAGWRLLTARPELLPALLRRPSTWLAGLVTAIATLPRLLTFAAVDKATGSGRPPVDAWRDPRSAAALLLLVLALLAWPSVQRRLPPAGRRGAALGSAGGTLLVIGGWLAWRQRAPGYDPTPQVHAMLDPALTAPWLIAAAALGAWELRQRAPQTFTALAGGLAGALLVYLGRYDCHSTYTSTGLATAPLVAALMAPALARLPGRALPLAAVLSGLAWSHGWLTTRYPKQQQWDLITQAIRELPSGVTLVYPADADLPPELLARGYKPDRLDLPRYVGDRVPTAPISARPPGPAWLLRTTDCHRPILTRGGRRAAWIGEERAWSYLSASSAGLGPRYEVEGVSEATPLILPDCRAALEGATPIVEVLLRPETSGSIYEEVRGADARVGLYALPAR